MLEIGFHITSYSNICIKLNSHIIVRIAAEQPTASISDTDFIVIPQVYHDLNGPCSMFEMMIALSLRCEETIMDDPRYGNRTKQWFWQMIKSLGLNYMNDDGFDRNTFQMAIDKFLNHKYEPNGKGGLFTIRECDKDLRQYDIWSQLCCYLDSISGLDV